MAKELDVTDDAPHPWRTFLTTRNPTLLKELESLIAINPSLPSLLTQFHKALTTTPTSPSKPSTAKASSATSTTQNLTPLTIFHDISFTTPVRKRINILLCAPHHIALTTSTTDWRNNIVAVHDAKTLRVAVMPTMGKQKPHVSFGCISVDGEFGFGIDVLGTIMKTSVEDRVEEVGKDVSKQDVVIELLRKRFPNVSIHLPNMKLFKSVEKGLSCVSCHVGARSTYMYLLDGAVVVGPGKPFFVIPVGADVRMEVVGVTSRLFGVGFWKGGERIVVVEIIDRTEWEGVVGFAAKCGLVIGGTGEEEQKGVEGAGKEGKEKKEEKKVEVMGVDETVEVNNVDGDDDDDDEDYASESGSDDDLAEEFDSDHETDAEAGSDDDNNDSDSESDDEQPEPNDSETKPAQGDRVPAIYRKRPAAEEVDVPAKRVATAIKKTVEVAKDVEAQEKKVAVTVEERVPALYRKGGTAASTPAKGRTLETWFLKGKGKEVVEVKDKDVKDEEEEDDEEEEEVDELEDD
ncbi:hypothetical protein BC829DRAFT_431783 [Chytridium lagenaria]|nr:hypothetical protein BC829DRAFT_431783 [Chytridium lagenaria]